MHMNVWHTIIQCTIVLGLSPKDTRPYPNTLPIRSLPGVNFWVFHPRDLSPFLIRLTRAFTFHHYFIFFPFNTFFTIFIISSHNHDEEHPEVLPALFMDPQEWYLHLKICKKEGVNISTLLSRVSNTQGVKWITKFQRTQKERFNTTGTFQQY